LWKPDTGGDTGGGIIIIPDDGGLPIPFTSNNTSSETTSRNVTKISDYTVTSTRKQLKGQGLKKLTAVIEFDILSHSKGSKELSYKLFPYGGSGNYSFRWRVFGEKYDKVSNSVIWEIPFESCTSYKNNENRIFCEITDKNTGEKYTTELTHPIICSK